MEGHFENLDSNYLVGQDELVRLNQDGHEMVGLGCQKEVGLDDASYLDLQDHETCRDCHEMEVDQMYEGRGHRVDHVMLALGLAMVAALVHVADDPAHGRDPFVHVAVLDHVHAGPGCVMRVPGYEVDLDHVAADLDHEDLGYAAEDLDLGHVKMGPVHVVGVQRDLDHVEDDLDHVVLDCVEAHDHVEEGHGFVEVPVHEEDDLDHVVLDLGGSDLSLDHGMGQTCVVGVHVMMAHALA